MPEHFTFYFEVDNLKGMNSNVLITAKRTLYKTLNLLPAAAAVFVGAYFFAAYALDCFDFGIVALPHQKLQNP